MATCETVDDLKCRIYAALIDYPSATEFVTSSWVRRLKACVKAEGGHFEATDLHEKAGKKEVDIDWF